MTIPGFSNEDFEVFTIDGLQKRMQAIRERIQPKFQMIGNELMLDLSVSLGKEMYLHIARHLRRTVNPPNDTWLAVADNNRGYKKHPHFQVGLYDDHVFIWLAYIYELPRKAQIATTFLEHIELFENDIPDHFVISLDHTKKDATALGSIDLEKSLVRFRDVKKAEFLVGRHIQAGDPILSDGDRLLAFIKETYHQLIPIYQLSTKL